MSNLLDHARRELEIAGYFSDDSVYGGMLGRAVLKMVEEFAAEGHSGMSARIALDVFAKVASFEPLTPLTGADEEWVDVTSQDGTQDGTLYQNVRCSHVFKDDKGAYDVDGRIFRSKKDNCSFTNKDSRVPVTFPYTPTREYVDVE